MELQTLSADEVERIHFLLVEDFKNTSDPLYPPGIRDRALLDSAVYRQFTSLGGTLKYPDAIENAATLTFGICCDHPFHNGNKRTALVAMLAHLDKNKMTLFGVGQIEMERMIIQVAEHSLKERLKGGSGTLERKMDREVRAISEWLRKYCQSVRRGERPITYRQLRRILDHFGYGLEMKGSNTIKVVGLSTNTPVLLPQSHVVLPRQPLTIGYHGDHAEVPIRDLKLVRRICRLQEEDGCDSPTFYNEDIMVDYFINKYRKILRRLAKK